MAPLTRAMRVRAAASADRLPPDFVFEALLRRPAARELCRLRAVCRTWRSITTDSEFIRAHAAAHPATLLLVRFRDDCAHVHVVDLLAGGGGVLKRIAGADGGGLLVLCPRLTLACLAADWNMCRVLNPANGAVQALPQPPAPEHKNRVNPREPRTSFAIGLLASTNEHKVLRVFNQVGFHHIGEQLFEVLSINKNSINNSSSSNSSGGDDANISSWRAIPSPDLFVEPGTGVVVDSVVYYLIYRGYNLANLQSSPVASHSDCILSFDLEREEWRRHLAGPLREEADVGEDFDSNKYRLGLAELKGCLVLVYRRRRHLRFVMDLWFLKDFENGVWVKEYTIRTRFIVPDDDNLSHVKPILFLNDGRLVIHQAPTGLLLIWDPQTKKFEQVGTNRPIDSVGIYTGSLLSLQ